jgi:uncharacterized glyoxalase superfamily protein PhnB
MPRSLAFYRDLLGFEVVSASPEVSTAEGRFSHWVWLRCGEVEIMLNTQYDSDERPAQAAEGRTAAHGDTCLYLGCADVDATFQQLTDRGLKASSPTKAPYGLKRFSVKDPDGYEIVFQEVR